MPILERVLSDTPLTYQSGKSAALLFDTLVSTVSSRQDIDSIYIRLSGYGSRIFTSETGIQVTDIFPDHQIMDLQDQSSGSLWCARRIKQLSASSSREVITINKLMSSKRGYVTVNYNASYITSRLQSFSTYEGQISFLIDNNRNIIASSDLSSARTLLPLVPSDAGLSERNDYIIYKSSENLCGLSYVSFIPRISVYKLAFQVRNILLLAILGAMILAGVISFFVTRDNIRNVHNIIDMLDCFSKGRPLPDITSFKHNQYHFIIQNIIKTYVSHTQLEAAAEKSAYQSRLMEALALQSQISPHFLFNTLENINWKAISLTGSPNSVNYMLRELSCILHYSMQLSNQPVLIQDEIDNTKHYLAIMAIRYPEKADIMWDYSPETSSCHIPKMILQPLIENAYSHGILRKEGRGSIRISISYRNGRLIIRVEDSGRGMTVDELDSLKKRLDSIKGHPSEDISTHIGLPNIHRRLLIQYNDQYQLNISSTYMQGTTVQISVILSAPPSPSPEQDTSEAPHKRSRTG
ncbi:MAG TPA: histidine kinase [Candidatus Mediterraneibacter norfolkensis]|nr:histidine kinase [Candidatus Mediterraneibacter norfolkensis]